MSTISGRNYTVHVGEDRVALARLRRRPELDTNAGADDAKEMARRILEIGSSVDRLVIDLADASPVSGPRTQATLDGLLREWMAQGRRVAVVIGPSAMQRLQIERMVQEIGLDGARVSSSVEAALGWLARA